MTRTSGPTAVRSAVVVLAALVAACVLAPAHAITALKQGDIALVQYGSEAGMDKLQFVTLVEIDAGTEFKVTDRGWLVQFHIVSAPLGNGPNSGFTDESTFSSVATPDSEEAVGEGILTYVAPSTLPSGSLITWCEGETNTGWSGSPGNLFEKAGDQVIVYRENSAPKQPCFIWAWTNTNGGGFDDVYRSVDASGQSPGSAPEFIKGTARDNEIDSDYPRNYYNPADTGNFVWPLMALQPIPNAATFLDDKGLFACGAASTNTIQWPELPTAGSFVYTGPVAGSQDNLIASLSDPLYFSSETGATAPAEITAPFTVGQSTTGTVFENGEVAPLEVTAGMDTDSDITSTFRLVFLTSFEAGTELYVTDRGLDSNGDFFVEKDVDGHLVAGDGTLKWKAPAAGTPGTILQFAGVTGPWSIVEGDFDFTTGGDQLILYQFDEDGAIVIIGMLQTGPYATSGTLDTSLSYAPSGMNIQLTAAALVSASNLYYQGDDEFVGISGRPNDLRDNIYDASEWLDKAPSPLVTVITVETALNPGEARVSYLKSSYDDIVDVVLLAPIVAGTRIYISDVGVETGPVLTSSGRQIGDGTLVFTAAADYPAGRVLKYAEAAPSAEWTATKVHFGPTTTGPADAGFDLNPVGDQVHIFQSDGVAFEYLSTINFGGRFRNDVSGDPLKRSNTPLLPFDSMAINGRQLVYKGPTTGIIQDLALALVTPAFWDSDGTPSAATSFTVGEPGTSVLVPGDVVITYVQTDGDPELSIMNLVPILSGTELYVTDMPFYRFEFYITDGEINQGNPSKEGVLKFIATSDIPTGTVIKTTAGGTTPSGTPGTWEAIRGSLELTGTTGDQLFVFQPHESLVAREYPSFLWGMDWTATGTAVGDVIAVGNNGNEGFYVALPPVARDAALAFGSEAPEALLDLGGLRYGVQLPLETGTATRYTEYAYLGGMTAPTCAAPFCTGGFATASGTRAVLLADIRQAENVVLDPIGYGGERDGTAPANLELAVGHWGYSTVVGAGPFLTPMSFAIQTTLYPGDVVVVNAAPTSFQVMFLVPAVAGTVVEVTDTGVDITDFDLVGPNNDFRETVLTYTVPAGGVTAGTIVDRADFVVDTDISNVGTLSLDFVAGDSLFVFQRAAGVDLGQYTFLHAVHVKDAEWDMSVNLMESRTIESESQHYVLMLSGHEAVEFRGPTSGTAAAMAAAFSNPRFWFAGSSSQITTLATNSVYSVVASSPAQPTQLTDGDLAVVRVESSASPEFDIVLLTDLAGGTSFYVTAMTLNGQGALGSALTQAGGNTGGTVKYTAPAGGSARGTVMSYPGPEWDVVESGFAIDDNVLHVFQYDLSLGDDADDVDRIQPVREVPVWLWTDDGEPGRSTEATELDLSLNNYVYRGPLSGDQPGLIEAIQNHVFWFGDDTETFSEVSAFTLSDVPPAPATSLGPDSVAFVTVNTAGGTSFRLLFLQDVAVGTSVCVTDNDFQPVFDGYDTNAQDGVVCFTAQAALTAGTIVGYDGTVVPAWQATEATLDLNLLSESLTAFQYDMTEVEPVKQLASFTAGPATGPIPTSVDVTVTALTQAGPNWVYRGQLSGTPALLRYLMEQDLFWFSDVVSLQAELATQSASVLAADVAPVTDLTPGKTAFVRLVYEIPASVTSEFDFVMLEAVDAGTVVYVTDHAYDDMVHGFDVKIINTDDGVLKWTAPTAMPAGTVITWPSSAGWSVVQGNFNLVPSAFGEEATLFQVDATATTLLATPLEILFYVDSEPSPDDVPDDVDGTASLKLPGGPTDRHWLYQGPTVGDMGAISTSIQEPDLFWVASDPIPPGPQSAFTVGLGSTTDLQSGDVAIVRVQADAPEEIQFVFLTAVAAGTEVFITDAGWRNDGTEFLTIAGDGFLRYTVPAGGLPASSVVTWDSAAPAPEFDEISPLDLAAAADQLLLFTRTSTTRTWLWQWSQGGAPKTASVDVTTAADTETPTGLAFTTILFPLSGGRTNAVYRGPTAGTKTTVQAGLTNPVFWFQDATTAEPDLTTAGFDIGGTVPGTALTAGDVAVIAYDSAANANTFTLVALCEMVAGTTFFVTDHGWTGTDFFAQPETDTSDVEGVLTFVTTVAVAAGTVFDSNDARFTIASGTLDFNAVTGDNLFLFQMNSPTPTFVWGWDNTGAWETLSGDVTTESDSMLPTGLGSQSSISLLFAQSYEYTGPSDGAKSVLKSAIGQGTPVPGAGGRRLFTLFWSNQPPSALPPIFNVNAVLTVSELQPGCVIVVNFNAQSAQEFALMLLDEIGPETEIYVTDNGFVANNQAGFTNAGLDGMIKYTAPATMPAGTIIEWSSTSPPPTWSVVQPGFAPGVDDQLLVFQFYNSPIPTFLWAFDTTGAWETGITDFSDEKLSELPLGAEFTTLLSPTVGAARYGGVNNAPASGTKADFMAAATNPNYWQVSSAGAFALAPGELTVETGLSPCDILVIAFLPGTSVQLATLVEVHAGTRIKITSKGWVDAGVQFFATSGPEGTVEYVFPSDTAPGSFITIDLSAESWPLATGDSILVYQGEETDGPPTFLWAFANAPFSTAQTTAETSLPAALAPDTCYTLLSSTTGGVVYDGPATGEPEYFAQQVALPDNWFSGTSGLSGAFVVQQQTLQPGCVAVVNFHSHEVLDQLQLLVLDTMAAGATFFVTDSGWSASGFITHEQDCVLRFTAPDVIPSGTVLTWTESDTVGNTAAGWTTLDCTSDFKLTSEGESILIYHANPATPREPDTFLWGFRNSIPQAWDTGSPPTLDPTDVALEKFSNLPDALLEFNTAVRHFDDYIYKGPMCGDKDVLIAAIRNPIFWFGDNVDDTSSTITGSQFAVDAFTVGACSTTNLQEGCIAVVEYQADADTDGGTTTSSFKLLLLDDVEPGTIMFVTDGGFDSDDNTFFLGDDPVTSDTDGMLRYTFPTYMPAGSIISWDSVTSQPNWEKCGEGVFDLNPVGGDQLFVFTAHTPTLPNFLFAMDTTRDVDTNPAGWEADLTIPDTFDSELPVGLMTELSLSVEFTNWVYTGHTSGSKSSLLAAIVSSAMAPDQSEVFWFGSTGPVDVAHALPAAFTIGAESMQKLNPGDVAIVEYDADPSVDSVTGFAIVVLVDVAAGTQLYVTDKKYTTAGHLTVDETNDSSDSIDEGAVRLTLTTDVKKGRVLYYPARSGFAQTDAIWFHTDESFETSPQGQLLLFQWRPEDHEACYLWGYVHDWDSGSNDPEFPAELDPAGPALYIRRDDDDTTHRIYDLEEAQIMTGELLGRFIAGYDYHDYWLDGNPSSQLPGSVAVQTSLEPGDIVIVSYRPQQNGDYPTTGYFQVLLLVDVCKGTQFIVTDHGKSDSGDWLHDDGSVGPDLSDGWLLYQAQSDLKAGTVLTYTGGEGRRDGSDFTRYESWLELHRSRTDMLLMNDLGRFNVEAADGNNGPIHILPEDQVIILQWTLADNMIRQFDPVVEGGVSVRFDGNNFPLSHKLLWILDATADGFETTVGTANALAITKTVLPPGLEDYSLETLDDHFAGRFVGSTFGTKAEIVAAVRNLANWEHGSVDTECVNTEVCELSAATFPEDVFILSCNGDRVGEELSLFGSITDDTTTTQVSIDWGDGSSPTVILTSAMILGPPGSTIRYFSAAHAYATAGTFPLVVSAQAGAQVLTANKAVDILGADVPAIVLDPIAPVPETSQTTVSGVVTPAETPVLTVDVSFGDGTTVTVPVSQTDGSFTAMHTYDNDGSYDVTVSGEGGCGTGTGSGTAIVDNVVPVVVLNMPPNIPQYGSVVLTGTVSDINPNDVLTHLTIMWGDGSTDTFDLRVSNPTLTYNPSTGEFAVTHMYNSPNPAATFTIQAVVRDDSMHRRELAQSAIASTSVTTVPECGVAGGLVLNLPMDCDQLQFDVLTGAQLLELMEQLSAYLTTGTSVVLDPHQFVVMSMICNPAPLGSSDVILSFKLLALSDGDAIVLENVLQSPTVGTNMDPNPLLPFTITGGFGDPVTLCPQCDESCVTCADLGTGSCTSCPDGFQLAGSPPAACVPLPSSTSSPSPSMSASTMGTPSVSSSASPSSSYGSVGGVGGAAAAVGDTETADAPEPDAPSTSSSSSKSNTPSASTMALPSTSSTPTDTPSGSTAALPPQNSVGGNQALPPAGNSGDESGGGSNNNTTLLVAALGGGAVVGLVVVVIAGVMYVRAKRRASGNVTLPPPPGRSQGISRRRNNRPAPTAPPSTLWRVMHTPPPREPASKIPASPV